LHKSRLLNYAIKNLGNLPSRTALFWISRDQEIISCDDVGFDGNYALAGENAMAELFKILLLGADLLLLEATQSRGIF
jgi:hypothetical protein